jgi:hypothetical protein
LPHPEFSDDSCPKWLQPLKQRRVGAVADSQPDNLRAAGFRHVAKREVFVFRHDAPAASDRKPPNLSVVGISQTNLATGSRFLAERPQKPCQRWRQLRVDEETHAIRLSDEDGMVEILGGVLEAGADIFSFQVRVVSKNLIL